MHTYRHAVLGGTFDHLHHGHYSHLQTAVSCAPYLTVGLTVQDMLGYKQFATSLEPFNERKRALTAWFAMHAPDTTFEIVEINDIYGPAGYSPDYDVLVATESTRANANKVNEKRRENNVAVLPLVLAREIPANDGILISSTRIRAGEIDRAGFVYKSIFSRDLTLPKQLRQTLRNPMGEVFTGPEHEPRVAIDACRLLIQSLDPPLIVAVGDIVSGALVSLAPSRSLRIVDYVTRRHTKLDTPGAYDVANCAGAISAQSAQMVVERIQQKDMEHAIVRVEGEEDLLVIPAVLCSPLGAVVLYGQPEVGIVAIHVTEQKKLEVLRIASQFE